MMERRMRDLMRIVCFYALFCRYFVNIEPLFKFYKIKRLFIIFETRSWPSHDFSMSGLLSFSCHPTLLSSIWKIPSATEVRFLITIYKSSKKTRIKNKNIGNHLNPQLFKFSYFQFSTMVNEQLTRE